MVKHSNSNANTVPFFREAAPYIHGHRDKTFVVAFAGEVIEMSQFRQHLQDLAIISSLGVRLVLVHGTRPQIDLRLQAANQAIQFHKGIRVTDANALKAAQEAIGFLRIKIENLLTHALSQPSLSNQALGLISGNFITAKPLGVIDGVDYTYSGSVRKINHELIQQQLHNHNLVLLSPIGYSPTGEAYNLRYEQVAIATAKAIQADKLIFLSAHPIDLPEELTLEEAYHYNAHPLMPAVLEALEMHIDRVHLLDAAQDGTLLLELYTRDGSGSLIAAEQFETLRQANIEDIGGILELIRPLEQKGILVKRSREQLELEINKFSVITRDRKIIACVALYDTSDKSIGELACLAVNPHYRGGNRGDKLFKQVEQTAISQGKKQLLVLTTQTTDWFKERGFVKGSIEALPENKKAAYNYDRNSQILFKTL
jgi:amino-acid N-acetyltransferase